MSFRKPSPSMAVAVAALVMATTGSAVAAVNYAKRAGKVDGKDAVRASASLNRAAGKLVATRRSGANKGRIPHKFLADTPSGTTFTRLTEVVDNAAGAAQVVNTSSLGALAASCNDQSNQAGREDPSATLTFATSSPAGVNLSRRVGTQDGVVTPVSPGTAHSFVINGSNTFELEAEFGGTLVRYQGHVRQDGRNTASASCLLVGSVETFTP